MSNSQTIQMPPITVNMTCYAFYMDGQEFLSAESGYTPARSSSMVPSFLVSQAMSWD